MLISIRLGNIQIGDRVREDFGNIEELAESIKDLGLLQPIVINSRHELIAGTRRLAAAELLGWTHINAAVVEGCDEMVKACAPSSTRTHAARTSLRLRPSRWGMKVEEAMKPAAKAAKTVSRFKTGNQAASSQNGVAKLATPLKPAENAIFDTGTNESETSENEQETAQDSDEEKPKVNTRAAGATAAKMSEESYRRAKEIVKAAEADPERFGDLAKDLEKERSVNRAYKELERRRLAGTVKADSLKDQLGNVVPDHLRDLFGDPWARKIADNIGQILDAMKDMHNKVKRVGPSYSFMLVSDILKDIAAGKAAMQGAQAALLSALPYALCPKCNGVFKGCEDCRKSGYVTEWRLGELKV